MSNQFDPASKKEEEVIKEEEKVDNADSTNESLIGDLPNDPPTDPPGGDGTKKPPIIP